MPGETLFFAPHLREANAQQFFLPFLFGNEIIEGREVYEPNARYALSGNHTLRCESRDVIER